MRAGCSPVVVHLHCVQKASDTVLSIYRQGWGGGNMHTKTLLPASVDKTEVDELSGRQLRIFTCSLKSKSYTVLKELGCLKGCLNESWSCITESNTNLEVSRTYEFFLCFLYPDSIFFVKMFSSWMFRRFNCTLSLTCAIYVSILLVKYAVLMSIYVNVDLTFKLQAFSFFNGWEVWLVRWKIPQIPMF